MASGVNSGLRPVRGTPGQVLSLLRDWEDADDPEPLVIETSGSSGRPKQVVLSRAAMRASVAAAHARLGGAGQWVLNLPPTYVAGVQVLFRSILAGVEPVLATDLVATDPVATDLVATDLGALRDRVTADTSYLSLVPTQLVRALRDPGETSALAGFDAVLVGGGPLAPAARAEAEGRGIRVVQTYGMSETCGGCVYDGRPLAGVQVRIDGRGQVLVAGPVLFDGYAGAPERTAAVLRDGWFRTDDLGTLEDGRLRVHGRADDVVVSGGLKVSGPAVAAALERHPKVREAHVLGVPDPEWGERVVAVVAADAPVALDELRDLVTPRPWAPRQVVVVPELPRLRNGKVDRQALRGLVRG